MPYTRQNVWGFKDPWDPTILWYARAVGAMKQRPLANTSSWRFYAAIHGLDNKLWTQAGYLSPADPMPSAALIAQYWKQCQHGSWYFLPWHRGYVLAIEAALREIIVSLKGPADWAMPYWNYFNPNQNALPKAFATNSWPDTGNNPLFVSQRYGPQNDGNVYVPMDQVNLDALNDPDFTGVGSGGSPGFGGVDTGFEHGGPVHGGLETQPHDWVHGLVGGADPTDQRITGLMSDPDTAGLDPIFWLHHANIDRLWEVWRRNPPSHVNPTDPNWLRGPGAIGERTFAMPKPDGTTWNYVPSDMVDLATLGYSYDDYTPAAPAAAPGARLLHLGATPAMVAAAVQGARIVPSGNNVELLGASTGAIKLSGGGASATSIVIDPGVRNKVSASLTSAATGSAPDRVFLNLENVRGLADATAFHVYVGPADGSNPSEYPERLAGSIALFGVRKASSVDAEHAGQGLTYVLEITKLVDALHLSNSLMTDKLDVQLLPIKPIAEDANVSIGRISIYRQGQ